MDSTWLLIGQFSCLSCDFLFCVIIFLLNSFPKVVPGPICFYRPICIFVSKERETYPAAQLREDNRLGGGMWSHVGVGEIAGVVICSRPSIVLYGQLPFPARLVPSTFIALWTSSTQSRRRLTMKSLMKGSINDETGTLSRGGIQVTLLGVSSEWNAIPFLLFHHLLISFSVGLLFGEEREERRRHVQHTPESIVSHQDPPLYATDVALRRPLHEQLDKGPPGRRRRTRRPNRLRQRQQ